MFLTALDLKTATEKQDKNMATDRKDRKPFILKGHQLWLVQYYVVPRIFSFSLKYVGITLLLDAPSERVDINSMPFILINMLTKLIQEYFCWKISKASVHPQKSKWLGNPMLVTSKSPWFSSASKTGSRSPSSTAYWSTREDWRHLYVYNLPIRVVTMCDVVFSQKFRDLGIKKDVNTLILRLSSSGGHKR